jgi:hypothetical protein
MILCNREIALVQTQPDTIVVEGRAAGATARIERVSDLVVAFLLDVGSGPF